MINLIALQSILDVQIWYLRSLIALEASQMIAALSVVEDILLEEEIARYSVEYPELYSFGNATLDRSELYSVHPVMDRSETADYDLQSHLGDYVPRIKTEFGLIDVNRPIILSQDVAPHIRFKADGSEVMYSRGITNEKQLTNAAIKRLYPYGLPKYYELDAKQAISKAQSRPADSDTIVIKLYKDISEDSPKFCKRKVTPIQFAITNETTPEEIFKQAKFEFAGRGIHLYSDSIMIASGGALARIMDERSDDRLEWIENLVQVGDQCFLTPPKQEHVSAYSLVEKKIKENIQTGTPVDLPRNLTSQHDDYLGLIKDQKAQDVINQDRYAMDAIQAQVDKRLAVHKQLLKDIATLINATDDIDTAIDYKDSSLNLFFKRLDDEKIKCKVKLQRSFYRSHFQSIEKLIIEKFGKEAYLVAVDPRAAECKEANERVNAILDSLKGNDFAKANQIFQGKVDISAEDAADALTYARMNSDYRFQSSIFKALAKVAKAD